MTQLYRDKSTNNGCLLWTAPSQKNNAYFRRAKTNSGYVFGDSAWKVILLPRKIEKGQLFAMGLSDASIWNDASQVFTYKLMQNSCYVNIIMQTSTCFARVSCTMSIKNVNSFGIIFVHADFDCSRSAVVMLFIYLLIYLFILRIYRGNGFCHQFHCRLTHSTSRNI